MRAKARTFCPFNLLATCQFIGLENFNFEIYFNYEIKNATCN